MEAYLDMLHFLMQPQTKLQLNPKTNNTQTCQKIELYGSLTTKDLKKPHSFRWVEGAEMWRQVERQGDTLWHGEVAAAVKQAVPITCGE